MNENNKGSNISISDTELYVITAQSQIFGALVALEHVSIANSTLNSTEISAELCYIDAAITLLYKAKQSYVMSAAITVMLNRKAG
jgi:hypothetical protein